MVLILTAEQLIAIARAILFGSSRLLEQSKGLPATFSIASKREGGKFWEIG